MLELIEAVRGRLIGPKTWDRIVGNCLRPFKQFSDSPWTVWTIGGIIYKINCVLVNRRPEMAMEIGFKKRNKHWMSGLPTDSPHALFWDCKNSPGFV